MGPFPVYSRWAQYRTPFSDFLPTCRLSGSLPDPVPDKSVHAILRLLGVHMVRVTGSTVAHSQKFRLSLYYGEPSVVSFVVNVCHLCHPGAPCSESYDLDSTDIICYPKASYRDQR